MLTTIGGLGDLGVCWWMSGKLVNPREAGRLQGRMIPEASPSDVVITTSDGLHLRGTVVEPASAHGVVVHFHGVSEWRHADLARVVGDWGHIGVAFDFRGHGTSDGTVTTFGWNEVRDVHAVIDFVRGRWPHEKIALWGFSLGGAALCYDADEAATADAVVLESVYATIDTAFERRIGTVLPAPLRPFALPARTFTAWRLGVTPAELQPMRFTGRLAANRTLLITGADDPWSGPDELALLAAPLPGCETHIVPGAKHNDINRVGGASLLARVRAFIDPRIN